MNGSEKNLMRQQGLSEPSVVPANDTVVAKTPGLSPTQDRVIIAINQVEYSNTPDGPLIHIFGRDVDGSTREIMVRGFRPYFYVLQSEAERLPLPEGVSREVDRVYYSIRGEPLNRIYTRRPTDVRDAREHFHHYEADIPFATRFLIDRGLTAGVEAPPGVTEPDALRPVDITAPARVAMIDIECDDSRGFPESSRDPILCISAHDSFSGMTGTFITASGISAREELTSARNGKAAGGCGDPSCHSIQIYDDEPAMIRGFAGWMKETDPDILSGWNFTDFDLPYILGRMNALGIPPASLSRLPGQVERAQREVREHANADDEVVGVVKLEEEGIAGIKRPEVALAAGLPEVHLLQVGASAQLAIPVAIRDADVELHFPAAIPGAS